MAELEIAYDIKEIDDLEKAITQTKTYISQNINERLNEIHYYIGQIDELKELNNNVQNIKLDLNNLNTKIIQLEALLEEIKRSSAKRIFHNNNTGLPISDQKDGTVAFIFENQ